MKLCIFIFALTTIIYGCQCAPTPGWEDNLKQDMENLRNKLHEDQEKRNKELEASRQQREETLRQLHERLEAARQQREETLRQLHERLATERQQREEGLKQLHERLDKERQQGQLETASGQGNNGYTAIIAGNYSSMTTFETINGNRVEKTVEERGFSNFKLRTIIRHTPALNKTEIQFYKCGLAANSQCILMNQTVEEKNLHNS